MPQLRQNTITGEWVIIAPNRGTRPGDTQRKENDSVRSNPASLAARHDAGCPFCPGSEAHIPPIILELNSTERPWQTRVITNKYPAVRARNAAPIGDGGIHEGIPLDVGGTPIYGHHEVIIESPRHDVDLADLSIASIGTVLETYHRRYHEIRSSDASMLPILFRNRGARAGASLHHPHSQLIAVPIAPARLRHEDESAARFYAAQGRCPYCHQIDEETKAASRLVCRNDHFVAYVPYAATGPFEVIVAPRRHCPDFGDVTADERRSLAALLRTVLRSLQSALGRPDYNYVIRSSVEYGASDPHLHWYLRIVPKLMQPGGFEVATGIPINPSSPEDDAALLRLAI